MNTATDYHVTTPERPGAHVLIEAGASDKLDVLDKQVITGLFKTHGALLIRGFQVDLDYLNRFTSRFIQTFISSPAENRRMVSSDGRTQTVNLENTLFPLHAELAQVPWRPDIAVFACENPPSNEGETSFCDGTLVHSQLDEDLRRELSGRKLSHKVPVEESEINQWLRGYGLSASTFMGSIEIGPYKFSSENGEYFQDYITPVFQQTMFSDQPAFANFLLFARYARGMHDFPCYEDGSQVPDAVCDALKQAADSVAGQVKWRKGDILMLDNTRFMHGRNRVVDPEERRIWTQFGYASFHPAGDIQQRSKDWNPS